MKKEKLQKKNKELKSMENAQLNLTTLQVVYLVSMVRYGILVTVTRA
jgi:hypothetical protein